MKKPIAPPTDPAVLAVLNRSGKMWRGMIASTRSPKPTIIQTRQFSTGELGGLDSWLDEHRVSAVLCVLPAAHVICRSYPLPNGSPEQLDQALRLQAEAHLLGIAPPHRLAMAVLPAAAGETGRTGLVLAWPDSSVFESPATTRPVWFVPDIACIAALLNGQRPSEPVLALDRHDGSIALALTHPSGVLFRATREDASNPDAWQAAVGRTVAESALSVNHTGPFIESIVAAARTQAGELRPDHGALQLPEEVRAPIAARLHLESVNNSGATWWADHGLALGAMLARTGPLAQLTSLRQAPPVEKPSPWRRVAERLSSPQFAARAVAVCLLLLLLGPLLLSLTRWGVLRVRHGDLSESLRAAHQARHQLAMYKELQKQNIWPMTKLLGDLTTSTPLGIELESLRIESGKEFSVSGTVIAHGGKAPAEVVALMEQNLREHGLFQDVNVQWGSANNLGTYNFDLTAKVAQPYKLADYDVEDDFGRWTHADRRDGKKPGEGAAVAAAPRPAGATQAADEEGGDEDPEAEAALADAGDSDQGSEGDAGDQAPTNGPTRLRPRTGTLGGRDLDTGNPADASSGIIAGSQDIPPPITEEQIQNWSVDELRAHLTKVANARKYTNDEKEEERLKNEFNMILAQIRKAQSTS